MSSYIVFIGGYMQTILTIGKRELVRLRSRFRGRARVGFLLVLAVALGLAFLAYQQSPTSSRGIYRVGLSPDAPRLQDGRFSTITVDAVAGRALLESKAIDAYIDSTRVLTRDDSKSQYAVNALKRVLEKSELLRINSENSITNTFPLRVEISYLGLPDTTPQGSSDGAVRAQLSAAESGGPQFQPPAENQIIIPSLTNPPNPFSQVIIAFLYIMPVFLVSVFFTSGFMDEKTNRRLVILLSAPLTPFQIIVGKMLPYIAFSLVGVLAISWLAQGNPLLSLAIFTPVILFIFSIYLIVPMLYRTFKDTTFISMLATAATTVYLILPAMFSGLSDLAYMSPITLAVKMYRAESFGLKEYLFATLPLMLIFGLALYVSTRVLNEEFLMGFRPIHRKLADAVYLILNREHPYLSIFVLSVLFIPLVYIVQLVTLAISLNLPLRFALISTLLTAAAIEEIAKSAGIAVLNEHGLVHSMRQVLGLSFLSALGFLLAEKALLLVSLGVVSQSSLSQVLFDSGSLPLPLAAHFVFTTIVCVLITRFRVRYPYAIVVATLAHSLYNYIILGGLR